jgi:hypothetical protein
LADCWAPSAEDAYYAFNDVHAVMAFIGAGDLARAERVVAAMARATGSNGKMTDEVGLPLARALLAFARGDYATCVEGLWPLRPVAHRFGGSNAQRDVIHLTLIEAALRAGRAGLGRTLVAERLAEKPQSPFYRHLFGRAQARRTEDGVTSAHTG